PDLATLGIPDTAFVGMRSELEDVAAFPEIVETATVRPRYRTDRRAVIVVFRREMPLADVVRRVTRAPQDLGNRDGVGRQGDAIPPHTVAGPVLAGEQARARRTADGLGGDRVGEVGAFARHGIEGRSQPGGVATVGTQAIPPELIGNDQ